jgi:hypothetical protein
VLESQSGTRAGPRPRDGTTPPLIFDDGWGSRPFSAFPPSHRNQSGSAPGVGRRLWRRFCRAIRSTAAFDITLASAGCLWTGISGVDLPFHFVLPWPE